jgi:hypothetical protein
MSSTVRQRSRIAWIALVAILLSTLAPAVSRTLAGATAGASSNGAFGEICSVDTSGSAWASQTSPADESSPADHETPSLEHCPYCLPQMGGAALPTAYAWPGFAPDRGAPTAWPAMRVPALAHAWSPIQPRAPPQQA